MPKRVSTYYRKEKGRVSTAERDKFIAALDTLPDGFGKITYEAIGKGRSSRQNAYMWCVLEMIANALTETQGEYVDKDDVHEIMKRKYNPKVLTLLDETEIIPDTTTKLDTTQFYEYVEKCRS